MFRRIFRHVRIEEAGFDRIHVGGARGHRRPDQLKATIGFDGGFLAEAEISYAGPGATARAQLAKAVLEERMLNLHQCQNAIRYDFIGLTALHGTAGPCWPGTASISGCGRRCAAPIRRCAAPFWKKWKRSGSLARRVVAACAGRFVPRSPRNPCSSTAASSNPLIKVIEA